jgi:ParB family chromosome partitioning protein
LIPKSIPIDKIVLSKNNVRKTLDDFLAIDELAKSIKENGLLQPVVVFHDEGQETYELIIGQRRYQACKSIGLKTIPAIIRKPMNSIDAIALSFIENIHRKELGYKDKTEVALALLNELGTIQSVADKLNVSDTAVRNYLGYNAVPDPIKKMVEEGKLSRIVAVRIAKNNPVTEKAVAIAEKIKEIPQRKLRKQILQTNTAYPDYSVEQVVKEAPDIKFKRVTIDLTSAAAEALKMASVKYEMEPEEIALNALLDYLTNEGFYGKK